MECMASDVNRKALIRKKSKSYTCLIALEIFMVLNFIVTVCFDDNISSMITLGILSILFVFLFCNVFFGMKLERKTYFIFIVFLFFGAVSYLINSYGLARLIGLSDILMLILIFRYSPLRQRERKRAFYGFLFCIFAVLLFNMIIKYSGVGELNTNTLGFLAAMGLCLCFIYLSRYKFSIMLPVTLLLGSLLLLVYRSRTAILCVALFVIMCLLLNAKRKTEKRGKVYFYIIVLSALGILFAYFYAVILYSYIGEGKIFILGKDIFSGRQRIWQFAFYLLNGNLLWGIGGDIVIYQELFGLSSVYTEMHNQPLAMIVGFGIIVCILFYIVLAYFVGLFYNKKSRYNKLPAVFWFSITIVSYFEIYLFSVYTWIPIMIAFGLITSVSRCGYKPLLKKTPERKHEVKYSCSGI